MRLYIILFCYFPTNLNTSLGIYCVFYGISGSTSLGILRMLGESFAFATRNESLAYFVWAYGMRQAQYACLAKCMAI